MIRIQLFLARFTQQQQQDDLFWSLTILVKRTNRSDMTIEDVISTALVAILIVEID